MDKCDKILIINSLGWKITLESDTPPLLSTQIPGSVSQTGLASGHDDAAKSDRGSEPVPSLAVLFSALCLSGLVDIDRCCFGFICPSRL